MPIYEYECACGYSFDELVVPGKKSQTVLCPKCGSKKIKKQLSTFSSCGSKKCESCSGCSLNGAKR